MPKMMKGLLGVIAVLAMALLLFNFLPDNKTQETAKVKTPVPVTQKEAVTEEKAEETKVKPEVVQKEEAEPETAKPETAKPEQDIKPQVTREFKDGVDYRTLKMPVLTDAEKGEIEVASVFWYGCPHCYTLEPIVDRWKKSLSDDIRFVRRPGFFGPNLWQTHAQLYYTIHNMGIEDKVHEGIFNEVQNKRNYLQDGDAMADYLNQRYGIDKKEFKSQFESFGVNHQLQQAFAKLKGYELTGVPALIIDGRYVIEAGTAGSLNNIPLIADYLIAKVQKENSSKAK